MTIDELNIFLEELFGSKEDLLIRNPKLLHIVAKVDPNAAFWHIEGDRLWKAKYWAISLEFREKRRLVLAKENADIDKNKEILEAFKKAISERFGITDDSLLTAMALEFKAKNKKIGDVFGVDLTQAPDLNKPYLILDDKGRYHNIGAKRFEENK